MRELEHHFNNMYDKFKLMLYDRALKERGSSAPGELSLQEVIYMEMFYILTPVEDIQETEELNLILRHLLSLYLQRGLQPVLTDTAK